MPETTHERIAIGGVPRPSRRSGCSPAIISGPGGGGWSVKKTANNSFDKISNYQSVNMGGHTAHRGKFVAYFRVSTDKQGRSGLGLDAQRKAVRDYLNGGTWSLIGDFTEVESGKRNERPELVKALAACKRHKAKLVIAKLDRLSRNLAFIATPMDSGVEFVAVDNPHANKLTVHILAAVAQHEREMIAQRT